MNHNRHTILHTADIREALKKINNLSGENMTLFVVDERGVLVGTLTDGDIRRHLLRDGSLDDRVIVAMHEKFTALRQGSDPFSTVDYARQRGIQLLPTLDESGRLAGMVDLRKVKSILPIDAVLMAGGRGERLRPLTLTTPKPLLEVAGKPIIDYNVEELFANGVDNLYVTVNYLKEQIIEHFEGEKRVTCVAEPKRLGTLGSLALIHDWQHDEILVMNSDLLTTLSFADMYACHKKSGAALTMAVIPYTVSVPFAVIDTDGNNVKGLIEKPTYNYFANAGVYILQRRLISDIKEGEYLDAPDFIEKLIEDGEKVTYFPINGTWVDIGSPDDFRNAQKLLMK